MRVLVAGAVAVVAAAVIAVAVAARGSDRSACGDVGNRERVVSPDGRRSAFVRCTPEGSAWLYLTSRGSERRLVPSSYGCCYRPSTRVAFRTPAWSPDGRLLAVVIEDVGGTDIWEIGVDGGQARRVTTGPAVERAPRWSADGRRITFRSETGSLASVAVHEPNVSR